MSDELIALLDTETTGLTSRDRVIELAIAIVDLSAFSAVSPMDCAVNDARSMLINPCGVAISPDAQAVNGITDSDVCDKPTIADVWPRVLAFVGDRDMVAHNAYFDRRMIAQSLRAHKLNEPFWRWYCSKLIAQRVMPGRATYSLQPLRHELRLDGDGPAPIAHRALGDVQTLAALLLHMRGVVGKPWGEW